MAVRAWGLDDSYYHFCQGLGVKIDPDTRYIKLRMELAAMHEAIRMLREDMDIRSDSREVERGLGEVQTRIGIIQNLIRDE